MSFSSLNPRIRITVDAAVPSAPVYTYTFLHPHPGDAPLTVDQRWEDLAGLLRMRAAADGMQRMVLTVHPPAASRAQPRQYTFRNVAGITGTFLASMFLTMLHSDETLELEGLRIQLQNIGQAMPSVASTGYGPPSGSRYLPSHLKNKGLADHPKAHRHRNDPGLALRCGPRALLLARTDLGFARQSFRRWMAAGEDLARDMGLPVDGGMSLQDAGRVLALPGWDVYRLVVFNQHGYVRHAQQGARWAWPDDAPKDRPDPTTLHLCLDDGRHYHRVAAPLTMVRQRSSHSTGYVVCFACFKSCLRSALSTHDCRVAGLCQCHICLEVFGSPEGLAGHLAERNSDYPPCEVCERTVFHGPLCQRRHVDTNCYPSAAALRRARIAAGQDVEPRRQVCDVCRQPYLDPASHVCRPVAACFHCNIEFPDEEARRVHHCPLPPGDVFWEPVRYTQENDFGEPDEDGAVVWSSHWAYDFETNRAEEIQPGCHQHAVFAWCLRLLLPCDVTHRYVLEEGVLPQIRCLLDPAHPKLPPHVASSVWFNMIPHPEYGETLRVYGRTLEQFIWVCENVCAHAEGKRTRWKPTFWAHNGSKFDAKFVFDYYANVRKLDLAATRYERDYGEDALVPERDADAPGGIRWARRPAVIRRNVLRVTNVGSKLLALRVGSLTFRCSHAHHSTALRNLPAIFGLKNLVAKGEFPYGRLRPENWGTVHPHGLPDLLEYDVVSMTAQRRKEVILWWIEEMQTRMADWDHVRACLVAAQLFPHELEAWLPPQDQWGTSDGAPTPWIFDAELWNYLFNDVDVLAACMEAYHRSAEELHCEIWLQQPDRPHAQERRVVSPLLSSTSPGWAYALYSTWFMPPDTLYTLRPAEHRYVRNALRGGRTDKRCNFVKISPERRREGDRMAYFDFKSLYPSVQKCSVHGTHFPVGIPVWISRTLDWRPSVHSGADLLREMADCHKTGFLTVDVEPASYSTHPTLHHLGRGDDAESPENEDGSPAPSPAGPVSDVKLLFANRPIREATFAWPELEEAILSGEVEVTKVHEALLFDKGTDVFDDYVDLFFAVKEAAERSGNKGLRSLAKLMLNSLWGKLGQRSYPVKEWVTWVERIDYLFERFDAGAFELRSIHHYDGHRAYIEYRVLDDLGNRRTTAPHVAAFVSMWGRVLLHRKLLRVHGQRALYCDTDSAVLYLRPTDTVPWAGSGLGDLTDELPKILEDAGHDPSLYPRPYIAEFVAVAPKTYAFVVRHDRPPLELTKVVCKGFEPTWSNAKRINYESMKALVFAKNDLAPYLARQALLTPAEAQLPRHPELHGSGSTAYLVESGKMSFKSNLATNQPLPVERRVTKALGGNYTKGRNHPTNPLLVVPFGIDPPDSTTFLDFPDRTRHFV